MAKRSVLRVADRWGFVLAGRAYSWKDLDEGRVTVGTTDHRDGQHIASRSNRCRGCMDLFRQELKDRGY